MNQIPPNVVFPGIRPPTSDMQATRDFRRAIPFNFPVLLTTARSIANGITEDPTDATGKALLIRIQGNVFFADPLFDLAGNSLAGIARIRFQDVSNAQSPFVTALPNALYRVPFTQMLVENYAQAGKYLQIVYGTDLDLVPGQSQLVNATVVNQPQVQGTLGILAQLALGGVNALQMTNRGIAYGAAFSQNALLVANTAEAVFAPAANVNGAIVWRARAQSINTGGNQASINLTAKSSAPVNTADGAILDGSNGAGAFAGAAFFMSGYRMEQPVVLAAGLGLYHIVDVNEAYGRRSVLYTLL